MELNILKFIRDLIGKKKHKLNLGKAEDNVLDLKQEISMTSFSEEVREPFNQPRSSGRIFHDFSFLILLMNQEKLNEPVLDFAAGSAWVSEFLVLMGFECVAFDIHPNLENIRKQRIESNPKLNKEKFHVKQGDGHEMPFENSTFGSILTFDSLHHMHDYNKVFEEFYRVLQKKGRAIFVEPGARHSKSPETIAFLKVMEHDPTWIERDVVLDEIDSIAKKAGFKKGVTIIPTQHPLSQTRFTMNEWNEFRDDKGASRKRFCDKFFNDNYNERIVFYVEK